MSFFPRLFGSSMALVAAAALSACSSTPAAPPDTSMPPPVDCGAATLSGKIGQQVTGSTPQDVRIGGEPVRMQGAVRVISPGQPVTQDYSASRLNLEVTGGGTLIRATCG